jgi:hypothetical protein
LGCLRVAPDPWALELVALAFAGGAFGASIGALPSFALAGLMVVVGELYALAAKTTGVEALPVDVTGTIAFGVVLGPHVAFGGGAAALAFAAKRGYLDTEFDYHPAKEVTRGLGNRLDVLAVGGIFGVVGHGVASLSASLALPVDPVALGVVASALVHRGAFGYSIFGARPGRWLDMSPFEHPPSESDQQLTDGGHDRVEPWLPYQYQWPNVLLLGGVMGVLGGYVAYLTASPFLAFGISVVALVMLNAGVAEIPVTHHMTLPASTAVLALVGAPLGDLTPAVVAAAIPRSTAVLAGGLFGVVGGFFGELLQRVFYAHAETHLDPPAASIVVTSFLIGVLAMVGVLPSPVWVPTP